MADSVKSLPKTFWALLVIVTLTILAAVLGCGDQAIDDTPSVYHGPPRLDAGRDASPDVDLGRPDALGDRDAFVFYGPVPIDAGVDAAMLPDADQLPDAGTPGVDACEPTAYYGPPPCQSDAECQADYGADWYCDQENTFPDGCGQPIPYPICTPK